jgi:hypothetical protein
MVSAPNAIIAAAMRRRTHLQRSDHQSAGDHDRKGTVPARDGPQDAPGALRGEVERDPGREQGVERRHGAQVARAVFQHRGVVAEEPDPGERENGREDADHQADRGGEACAEPGDALGALGAAGADVRADEHHERLADREDPRALQELEAQPTPEPASERRRGVRRSQSGSPR